MKTTKFLTEDSRCPGARFRNMHHPNNKSEALSLESTCLLNLLRVRNQYKLRKYAFCKTDAVINKKFKTEGKR